MTRTTKKGALWLKDALGIAASAAGVKQRKFIVLALLTPRQGRSKRRAFHII
jgi:hypothetical protein